eukprot:6867218-Lingulodinium_polyedra.AAC.1
MRRLERAEDNLERRLATWRDCRLHRVAGPVVDVDGSVETQRQAGLAGEADTAAEETGFAVPAVGPAQPPQAEAT